MFLKRPHQPFGTKFLFDVLSVEIDSMEYVKRILECFRARALPNFKTKLHRVLHTNEKSRLASRRRKKGRQKSVHTAVTMIIPFPFILNDLIPKRCLERERNF